MKIRLLASFVFLFALSSVFSAGTQRGIKVKGSDADIKINDYDPSRFHALVIGISDYRHWPDLRCAANDAEAFADVLKECFAFGDVRKLINRDATREKILEMLDSFLSLDSGDCLVIYFSGHGWMDERTGTGYWIPYGAAMGKKYDYIANSLLVWDYFQKYRVRHLLVIADSCFSGTLLRGDNGGNRAENFSIPSAFQKPSRWIMTSGGLHPVPDGSGPHSPFASRILQYMKYSESPVFGVHDLFVYVRRNIDGCPVAQPLRGDAHMPGGEFIFRRQASFTGKVHSASVAGVSETSTTGKQSELNESKPLSGKLWKIPSLGIEMLPVAPGVFNMGSAGGEKGRDADEGPVHEVRITKPFWMSKCEVTEGEYRALSGSKDEDKENSVLAFSREPVCNLSWLRAREFCRRLTERERRAGRLPASYEYRLPTEAEWEYCCRAGTDTAFAFGDSVSSLKDYANYADIKSRLRWKDSDADDAYAELAPVASFKPNTWGFYDMHGNVWEFCRDLKGPYRASSSSDPVGPSGGNFCVIRGGSWYNSPGNLRSASRSALGVKDAEPFVGFRIVLAPAIKPFQKYGSNLFERITNY